MRLTHIEPEFVEFVPNQLVDGVLYISMPYATAVHKCACGCGQEVVTPFSPTDWQLTFDGTVSLRPSIGNWNFDCQSHYWIRNDRIQWSGRMSREKIDAGRRRSRLAKQRRYGERSVASEELDQALPSKEPGFFRRLIARMRG